MCPDHHHQEPVEDRDKQNTVAQPFVADSNGVVSFHADGCTTSWCTTRTTCSSIRGMGCFTGASKVPTTVKGCISKCQYPRTGDDGDYFHVTGTTPITAIQGTQPFVWLTFDSALTLTHSSSLVLKGA